MFKKNNKVNFEIRTARKGEGFSLAWSGRLTVQETTTHKNLRAELISQFLEEINKPTHKPYTASEVRVKLSAVA